MQFKAPDPAGHCQHEPNTTLSSIAGRGTASGCVSVPVPCPALPCPALSVLGMGYYSIFLTRAYYCTYIILSFTSITCRLLRAIPRRRGNAAGLPRLRVVSARADPPEPFSRILVQLQSRSSFVAADTCILEPGLNPICHQWTCINHHHGRLCCGIAVFFFLLPLSFRPSPATLLLIPSWFIYSPLGNFPFRRLCSSPMIMMLSRLLTQGDLIRSNATHTSMYPYIHLFTACGIRLRRI